MIHPLSLLTYYRRNLNRVGIVVGVLGLALFAVVGVSALTGSFKKDAERAVPFYHEYYTIYLANTPGVFTDLRSAAMQKIVNDGNLEYSLEGDVLIMKKESLVGNQESPVLFLNPQDQATVLKTLHLTLDKGSYPVQGTNQIALTGKLLSNRKKNVGDVVGDQVEQFEYLAGKYQVSGSLKSEDGYSNPEFLGIGSGNYTKGANGASTTTFILRPKAGHSPALDTDLHDWQKQLKEAFPGSRINIETEYSFQELINQNFRFMDVMVGAIMAIITLVMTLSVALFNIIIFMQRSTEFGLLLALGYSRRFILRKTLVESIGQIILAILLGIGLTSLTFAILNHALFTPNGFAPLTLFNLRNLYFALPLPIAVAIFAILTILSRITRLDPISILEKRD
jgi:ABC-type antimicrobial peptide transport system permease subunit